MQKIGDIPNTRADSNGEFTDGNVAGGVPPTILPAEWLNTIQRELINILAAADIEPDSDQFDQVATAVSKLITDGGFLKTVNNLVEIKNAGAVALATTLANLGLSDVAHLPQLTGVVGTSRNAKMSVTAASATATFTADELIVQTALGGRQYKLSNFNKTINLAAIGAGGMDTGTAPTAGFVALYAIYNPTTQASALLAVNATSVLAPEVYSGANMPAGYTASALVSVWRTASSQFTIGYQLDRNVSFPRITVLTTTTGTTPLLPINMPNYIPINAKYCSVDGALGTSTNGVVGMAFSSSISGIGWRASAMTTTAGYGSTYVAMNIPIITTQTIYYSANATVGTLSNFASNLVDYVF
ncbi:hypothetical protein [Yersinia massiliensis]|uniref:hypothetical protein n=1 Tax=Yersinia massiliensis TaxID=419257 RepID=UPI0002EE9881|nr:hypothetical protein [Yersinia massiliensis]